MTLRVRVTVFPIAVLLSCSLHQVMSSKFLLVGTLSTSHQLELISYGEGLIERGHQVYSAYPEGNHHHATLAKSYGIEVIYFKANNMPEGYKTKAQSQFYSKLLFIDKNARSLSKVFTENIRELCRGMMRDKQFKTIVESLHFDLAVVDAFLLENCLLVVPYNLSIPFVAASPSLNPWDIGLPTFPSFTPNPFLGYPQFMSLPQRIMSLVMALFISSSLFPTIQDPNIIEDFAPALKSQRDLLCQAQMFIITRDHHLEWPAIQMPHVLTLPGITQRLPKAIEDPLLLEVIDHSQALILVTFGTTASGEMMPQHHRDKFATAFQRFPNYTFLWQFEKEFLDEDEQNWFVRKLSENVVIFKWLPQNDLLAHPKTVLFLTHCGNYGQYEAIHHGVPMLGFPIFAEQSHNANRMFSHGFGLTINIHQFTADELEEKMHSLLSDSHFQVNLNRISHILKQRVLPYQEAALTLEVIAKHGGGHLLPATLILPWYKVLMIDVLAFLLVLTALIILGLTFILRYVLLRFIRQKGKKLKAG